MKKQNKNKMETTAVKTSDKQEKNDEIRADVERGLNPKSGLYMKAEGERAYLSSQNGTTVRSIMKVLQRMVEHYGGVDTLDEKMLRSVYYFFDDYTYAPVERNKAMWDKLERVFWQMEIDLEDKNEDEKARMMVHLWTTRPMSQIKILKELDKTTANKIRQAAGRPALS